MDTLSFIVTTIAMNSVLQPGAKRIDASDDEERKPFCNLELFSATVCSTSVSEEAGDRRGWGERGHMDGCKGRRYGESWEILQEWDASLQVSLSPTKTASASSILFMFHIFDTLWVHRLLVVGTHFLDLFSWIIFVAVNDLKTMESSLNHEWWSEMEIEHHDQFKRSSLCYCSNNYCTIDLRLQ